MKKISTFPILLSQENIVYLKCLAFMQSKGVLMELTVKQSKTTITTKRKKTSKQKQKNTTYNSRPGNYRLWQNQ